MKCDFGLLLQNALDRNGYTQKKAAQVLNVTPQTVNSYIQGRSVPNIEIFERMMKCFGLELTDVFEVSPLSRKITAEEVLEVADTLTYHQNFLLKAVIIYFHMVNTQDQINIEEKSDMR